MESYWRNRGDDCGRNFYNTIKTKNKKMATTRNNLKEYFETGKKPTQSNFEELIDSVVHKDEDRISSALPIDVNNDEKFVTPKVAKMVVDAHAVRKVNGLSPDSSGNVAVTNVSGTASTITGNINKSQVNGLQADLDGKLNSSNLRTVNGNSLIGTSDLVVGGGSSSVLSKFLITDQVVTGAAQTVLTGNVFVIPPGKSAVITGLLAFTSNLQTSGVAYGIKVQQQNGGTGNVVGSWSIEISRNADSNFESIRDGSSFSILPNNTGGGEVTSTVATTAATGNISATLSCILQNLSATLSTTVSVTIRPSTSTAAVTAKIGSGTFAVVS